MKKLLFTLFLALFVGCSSQIIKQDSSEIQISYNIDVTDHTDDLFHITVNANNLGSENNIYHFASTAPGTYQLLDFGRFVKNFSAFDKMGNKISSKQISTNKWKIENVEILSKIEYDVEDSFDAEINKFPISPMCGSGIEKNFIAINTFAVLGYFNKLQSNPLSLTIDYESDWTIGTSLPKNSNECYYAENYDHLADSPILIGDLSVAETFVNDISVKVYLYSENENVNADSVMVIAEDVLKSASDFIGYSPVPDYKFLVCLLDDETFNRNKIYGSGALEHSLSSLYVMPSNSNGVQSLLSTMAHEFMHILTPLFLHSEIIHSFNFETPSPSQHIWLYEGVTEWNSDIMQLRAGLIDSDHYMDIMTRKLRMNDFFDQNISLRDVALKSYDESGYGNFLNFYEKGAVVAALLDLRLLELSNGKKGLREVFLSLLEKYGKNKPFSEKDFFNTFVNETYPEIKDFIEKYIKGNESLPCDEYFSKIGYRYIPERVSFDKSPKLGFSMSVNENQDLIIFGNSEHLKAWGLEKGDIIKEIMGMKVTLNSLREFREKIKDMNIGDEYSIKVIRGNEEIIATGKLQQLVDKHIFVGIDSLTEEQINFRKIWSKNL